MSDAASEITRLRAALAASEARAEAAESELAQTRAVVSTSEAMIKHLPQEEEKEGQRRVRRLLRRNRANCLRTGGMQRLRAWALVERRQQREELHRKPSGSLAGSRTPSRSVSSGGTSSPSIVSGAGGGSRFTAA